MERGRQHYATGEDSTQTKRRQSIATYAALPEDDDDIDPNAGKKWVFVGWFTAFA